ncbi:hypothetical protein [Asticcacaulis sp.]|uniref:hypothetical protein n=1 Tax=Asticcacaulis sp. TaxID=1872648 RepID=UPI003F7C8E8C
MALDPDMQAALAGDVIGLFVAVEIEHPLGTIRLLDGAGVLVFGGHTFVGHDDAYGSLGALDISADGQGNEAPTAQIAINVADMTIGPALCTPAAQGAATSVWVGAFNPVTGLVLGQPDLRFYGEIDTIDWDRAADGTPSLQIEAVSGFERFFENDEGNRLNDTFHQSIWPGEKGLEFMTTVLDQIPWGIAGAKPPLTKSGTA